MNTSRRGIALIKGFEGLRLRVYVDLAGVATIGYGHTEGVTMATLPITEGDAEIVLAGDLVVYEVGVSKLVKVPLNQNQFDALVSFAFNLGVGALKGSTLLKYLNAGRYTDAAAEFHRWNMAAGKTIPGLTRRRAAERNLFMKIVMEVKNV